MAASFVSFASFATALTRRANGLPLGEMKIVSPFGGKISYNFYSALRILPRHQERHLEQAEDAASL